ncbi:MAG: hypothetical protein WCS27_07640 [Victivallaceae bacterium]
MIKSGSIIIFCALDFDSDGCWIISKYNVHGGILTRTQGTPRPNRQSEHCLLYFPS